jgi:hypothetical protein
MLNCHIYHKCGTLNDASSKLTIEKRPSPSTRPDARTMRGVSDFPLYVFQYQLSIPPMARANVKDGELYIPMATAMPPGM